LINIPREGAVPCCTFSVKWTKPEKQPVKLVHRIKLLGAKEPSNFVTLEIDPPQTSLGTPVITAETLLVFSAGMQKYIGGSY